MEKLKLVSEEYNSVNRRVTSCCRVPDFRGYGIILNRTRTKKRTVFQRIVGRDGRCLAVEAWNITSVLNRVFEKERETEFWAPEFDGPQAEQFPVQLWPAVFIGPHKAEHVAG